MQLVAAGQVIVVYVAIDGASNTEQCVQAVFERYCGEDPPAFALITPTLDLGRGDEGWEHLEAEINTRVEGFRSRGADDDTPVVVVAETLSAALNGADENGSGAQRFLAAANALVKRGPSVGQVRTFIYTHHGDLRPRGTTAQLGNTDRVLRVVQRQNRVVTVSTMPNGPNGKDRFGPGGQEFARFKMGTYKTKTTGDTVGCVVPLDATESTKAPEGCPPEFRDAWLALDAAGASDGIARADLVEILGSLAKAAVKPGTGPDAVRKRRKR